MKELKIEIPDGYVIDVKNSSIVEGIVKFKKAERQYPKSITELSGEGYYISTDSEIIRYSNPLPLKNSNEDRNLVSTKERAEAFLALMQLVELRDVWNKIDRFEVDWGNRDQLKYIINTGRCKICTTTGALQNSILHFGNSSTRDKFLETFRDLIETAKELL